MQILIGARYMDDQVARESRVDPAAEETAIAQYRARGDRRAVLISVTPAGRHVVDEATGRRRALIADIMTRLPVPTQQTVAQALRAFADAAGRELP
jgi:DNA-binding MarR family transcriptional regulator